MKKPQTQAAIAKILADCKTHDLFTVTFAPITSPAWLKDQVGETLFVDANDDHVDPETLGLIAKSMSIDVYIDERRDNIACMGMYGGRYIWVAANHIANIIPRKSPITTAKPEGLAYDMAFNAKTGECKVGCQTLTRAGCEQAFKALGAHLGYDITG